ncbi:MAG: hypothetical protein E3K37_16185 [Candidatus Kuenenia sp.]|nr:hypothetical protein [Candidatus Kuenenia hertensis]
MIKEIFTGNLLTKFMAMVMAVALWLYAINRHTEDLREVIKLSVSVPTGITVIEQSTEEIVVHLRGPLNVIENTKSLINDQKIQAKYLIQESPEGIEDQIKQTIFITREHLNLPNSVKLISVYPEKINVLLGKLQKKRLKVNLLKKGEPAIGYAIANEFVFPAEVEVEGPLNALKEVVSINTVPVDIGGITIEQNRTFPWRIAIDQKVVVKQGDKSITVPVSCGEDVRVWLQAMEKQETKVLEKLKIKILMPDNYPYVIKLRDEYVNIKVKGPKLLLEKLNPEDIVPYVDVTSLKPPGPYKQPIKCNLGKNFEIVDKLPDAHLDIRERGKPSEGGKQ